MNELMIALSNESKKPFYEQIYDYIRKNIADGKISCGERLPSTRFLAKHLQISRSTVAAAYDQLLAEGYLVSEPCRGYFASDVSKLYRNDGSKPAPTGTGRMERKEEQAFEVTFSPDQVDMAHFPYQAFRKINRNLFLSDNPGFYLAGKRNGEDSLRRAIQEYLYHARGVACVPEQIVVGAGNEYLLILLMQVMGKEKKIAMENPTYFKAYRTFLNCGCKVCPVEMDGSGICIGQLSKENPDIVYTMPSHQFPTGIVMPMKRRLELLEWAMEQEMRFIIEDDHDSEFRYRGKPIPSLQGCDPAGKVIYIGTFSKSIAPALRVSYMVLPEILLQKYEESCGFYSSTVPRIQQELLAEFLNGGYFERHLNKMRGIYKAKHDFFMGELKKEPWVEKIYGDNAGLHLLVEVKSRKQEAQICAEARKRGIQIYSLSQYRIEENKGKQVPTLVLGYGALEEGQIRRGIALLGEMLCMEAD